MPATRVGAAEQLHPRHVHEKMIELVAWRLLDLPYIYPGGRIDPFGPGLGEVLDVVASVLSRGLQVGGPQGEG